jgi:hypothetical protein
MTLLARDTLSPISLSPVLMRCSSARTSFPLFAPLTPAPEETADSRVSSGPGPEVLYAPCQPQHSPPYGIQSADSCIPRACLNCLQATNHALDLHRQRYCSVRWTSTKGTHAVEKSSIMMQTTVTRWIKTGSGRSSIGNKGT